MAKRINPKTTVVWKASQLIGTRVAGRLILSVVKLDVGIGASTFLTQCKCGAVSQITLSQLLHNNGKDCRHCRDHPVIHGHCRHRNPSPEWRSWSSMRHRIMDPNHNAYHRYGGRGILICDRWLNSFTAFLSDVGPRPSKKHSIHRIDNDGNYEPGNVRWATTKEQALNKSRTVFVTVDGVKRRAQDVARERGWQIHLIRQRINHGWTEEEALRMPYNKGERKWRKKIFDSLDK